MIFIFIVYIERDSIKCYFELAIEHTGHHILFIIVINRMLVITIYIIIRGYVRGYARQLPFISPQAQKYDNLL